MVPHVDQLLHALANEPGAVLHTGHGHMGRDRTGSCRADTAGRHQPPRGVCGACIGTSGRAHGAEIALSALGASNPVEARNDSEALQICEHAGRNRVAIGSTSTHGIKGLAQEAGLILQPRNQGTDKVVRGRQSHLSLQGGVPGLRGGHLSTEALELELILRDPGAALLAGRGPLAVLVLMEVLLSWDVSDRSGHG